MCSFRGAANKLEINILSNIPFKALWFFLSSTFPIFSVIPLSHPLWVFDKVAPTRTLGNPLWRDAILDSLFRPLDNICKLRIIREMVEVPAVGA